MLLKTERLTIRHVVADDWKSIRDIWVDFNSSEYAQYDTPHITEDANVQARIAKLAAANSGTEHMFFAVCLNGTLIGYIAFNIRENGYEIGYCFHSAYHGKGYAKESHLALFDYLRTLGINKFSAGTALKNTPSVKLLTSLGFKLVEQEKVSFYKDTMGNDIVFDGGIFEMEYSSSPIIPHDDRYRVEQYKNCKRFNEQYQSIHQFLLKAENLEYNEHFHWGRFEWMHTHSFLDEDKLTSIVIFKDKNGEIVGLITYDTCYDDRAYLIHTSSDKMLLASMIDTVLKREDGKAVIKANVKDTVLCQMLQERQFEKKHRDSCVLALDLVNHLEYSIPSAYSMSPQGFLADPWEYQLVIHKGFDNVGVPEKWDADLLARIPNKNEELKTYAIANDEYCAHCGLWYTEGDTAYVEPVVTLPQHRKQGLAKAVVYEACNRAHALGAKRATVLSNQAFYYRIGFALSSEVYCWERSI